MISEALTFLKDHLNAELKKLDSSSGASAEIVEFVAASDSDTIVFKKGAVTVLVVGIEEEKTLRAGDPYRRPSTDGTPQRVQPDIRLYLYVLFVACYSDYKTGLLYLSHIIQHFQTHRVFDHQDAPELSDNIDQLIMELHTLPLSEQHDLWNALRTSYQPSVLYKIKMVVFSDEDAVPMPVIKEKDLRLSS